MPLADAVTVPFERVGPVRTFPAYKGQRNFPGFYYAACLERDEAMALDFDAAVAAFAAQRFWLSWPDTDRLRSHAPDFFARTTAGVGVIVDCRPAEQITPRDAAAFAATERACREVGWQYRLVTGHDPVWSLGSALSCISTSLSSASLLPSVTGRMPRGSPRRYTGQDADVVPLVRVEQVGHTAVHDPGRGRGVVAVAASQRRIALLQQHHAPAPSARAYAALKPAFPPPTTITSARSMGSAVSSIVVETGDSPPTG